MGLFIWLLSCTGTTPPPIQEESIQLPNILLITIDTLRADRLGVYGDRKARTPIMDRLALEGYLFAESHSVTPLTLPSHSSILTGLLPKNHGMRDNAGFRLADETLTIAEQLQSKGYHTAAFISAFVLSHSWGLDQGFDVYHDPFHPRDLLKVAAFGEAQLPGNETLNVAKNWWKTEEGPKFAWVHVYEPHSPWEAIEGWEGDPYRGEIAKVDRWLGDFLDLVKKDTWVILTSDHGESLWEGGEREHSVLLHRSVTRVPLIIRPPKGLQGQDVFEGIAPELQIDRPLGVDEDLDLEPVINHLRAAKLIHQPVSALDIAPTIAEIAGVDFSADGQSLLPLLQGKEIPVTPVYAETVFPYFHFGWAPLKMMQNSEVRLEQGVEDLYFHPQSLQVLSDDGSFGGNLSILALEYFGDDLPLPGPVNDKEAQALSQLGYLTDAVMVDLADAPDPRTKISVLRELERINLLPVEESIPLMQKMVEENPDLVDVRLSLSYLLNATGRVDEALQVTLDVLKEFPSNTTALNNAVLMAHFLKQYELAEQMAFQMQVLNSKDMRSYRYLAAMYVEREMPEKVLEVGYQGLAIEETDPNLNYVCGLSEILTQQYAKSVPHLLAAQKYNSRATDIDLWLGFAWENQKDVDQAIKYYELASKQMPLDPRPNAMAGVLLAQEGRCDEARKFLLNVVKRQGSQDAKLRAALDSCEISY